MQPPQPPVCLHGDPAILNIIRKEGPNNGRRYWHCARPHAKKENCRFFQWADADEVGAQSPHIVAAAAAADDDDDDGNNNHSNNHQQHAKQGAASPDAVNANDPARSDSENNTATRPKNPNPKRNKTEFVFPRFRVFQDLCSQKIGTDSMILGAYAASISDRSDRFTRILDVGSGSGVLSLMVAQKYDQAIVHAVDIEIDSYNQTRSNFELNSWRDRMHAFHCRIQDFVPPPPPPSPPSSSSSSDDDDDNNNNNNRLGDGSDGGHGDVEESLKYDMIISNPPYFKSGIHTKPGTQKRTMARHTDTLPFDELIAVAHRLMRRPTTTTTTTTTPTTTDSSSNNTDNKRDDGGDDDDDGGVLIVVLPHPQSTREFEQKAVASGLRCIEAVHIRNKKSAPIIRHIYQFKFATTITANNNNSSSSSSSSSDDSSGNPKVEEPQQLQQLHPPYRIRELCIRNDGDNRYSNEFRQFVQGYQTHFD